MDKERDKKRIKGERMKQTRDKRKELNKSSLHKNSTIKKDSQESNPYNVKDKILVKNFQAQIGEKLFVGPYEVIKVDINGNIVLIKLNNSFVWLNIKKNKTFSGNEDVRKSNNIFPAKVREKTNYLNGKFKINMTFMNI
ncbi:hypothetical protein H312_03500 [Anncaliia algerae PRA339]|uniref:Uncharacterized protein n=1 Tax=Anncaliia algerae PRA339 TaxID=1288291 RepID=A0A059EWK6_9MICR|nr:hypothetical protein H312_03500 [Anncaliia algerae PRA339]